MSAEEKEEFARQEDEAERRRENGGLTLGMKQSLVGENEPAMEEVEAEAREPDTASASS